MKFNESITVEKHILEFLEKELGYQYIEPAAMALLRNFENEYLVEPMLILAIKKINNLEDETIAQSIYREVKKIDTNQEFLNVMRSGIDLVDAETRKTVNYKIVDFQNPQNNLFAFTNQFYFEGNSENIIPDILVFINGIPVVDIEAKSPTASISVTYEKAIGQLKRYEKVARKLFISNCFNIATDGQQTAYGATYAPPQYFLTWRDEDLEKKYVDAQLEVTLAGLLDQTRLCDMIENFLLFEQARDGIIKKIARYQQVRAANKIVERVKNGAQHKGLIWHTQGSGKTLTMFFAAWKLRFDASLKSPKIFILVDRIDLDDQVFDEFVNHGGKNIIRITSRKDLEEKIQSDERGIFISTMQKFAELGDKVKNLSENVIIFSDEAHRGDEGEAGINLRSAFGHAFFFGFTGTPIDKHSINTHRNYGEEGERYLDYYSIQQAIDDHATLPVTYEARLSKFAIDDGVIDEQFDVIATELSDEQKQEVMKRYAKKSALVKLPKRMEAVARDIIEHFKVYVEPSGFKAQVVCFDREATALYKQLFDKLIPGEWSAVVYSAGDPNELNQEQLAKYNTSKKERDELIRNFKNPTHPLRFLLVCDMLLTGFDAPIEQVMYLDKPLRDHSLLQAIARTNRVSENKLAGKIIDYYGITKNLHDALNFDEEIIDSAMVNIDVMKDRFVETMNETMELFGSVNIEDPSMKNLRRNLKIFIDNEDKQEFFAHKYNKLKSLFEFLSPDPFLKEYVRRFGWLTSFYLAFQKEFRSVNDQHLLSEYGGKVRELIQENVDYEGITKTFREMNISDIAIMNQLNKMDDEEKALNLEKMLKQEISEHVETNPIFQKFSERLQRIRKEFETQQLDLSARIKQYEDLMKDIRTAHDEAKELGFDLKEYGLFMIEKEYLPELGQIRLSELTKEMSYRLKNILDTNWQESSKQETFLKEIKRMLQELLLKDFELQLEGKRLHEFMNRLVDNIVKHF